MINIAIYNISTGKIRQFSGVPASMVDIQCDTGEDFYLNCPDTATHIINDDPVTIPSIPTEQEIISMLTNSVQRHLDEVARQRNYDGILSLCTYSTSLDAVFRVEGQAGVEWRDSCWRTCYQIMTEVRGGTRQVPTVDDLVALLPVMVWP
jgi:hypothetical protein